MEIERKYLITAPPQECFSCPCRSIEQAYLCDDPVVRIRRDGERYYLTYKGRGLLAREEANLPLNEASYRHLLSKADGIVLTKKRYCIPLEGTSLTIELDVPDDVLAQRKANWQPRKPRITAGYLARYAAMVTSGNRGAVLEVPKSSQQ